MAIGDDPTLPADRENPRRPLRNDMADGLGRCDDDGPSSLTDVIRRRWTGGDGNDPIAVVCARFQPVRPKGYNAARMGAVRVKDE